MSNSQTSHAASGNEQWLKQYYFTRGAFSVLWVAAALTAGQNSFVVAAALLIIYPAWDAAEDLKRRRPST
jgi:ABC-type transport system involved in cytochrome bd biosynthesis fused ATPase/permease subunit